LVRNEVLEVAHVTKRFAGLVANDDVTLSIREGEILGLIGPNGAGKTTLFNSIAGYYAPTSGKVLFLGRSIVGLHCSQICRLGIARTFQIMKPIRGLTVLENVMIGAFCRTNDVGQARRKARQVIEEVGLLTRVDMLAARLTVADLRRLEIARALATEPKLLLLDETMAGLTPTETRDAVALVHHIRETGVTIFMIEHVMDVIRPLADRVIVLELGKKIAEGPPDEVLSKREVIEAYLGQETCTRNPTQGEQPC